MSDKAILDEQAIVAKILQRRNLNNPRIPAEKVKKFKAKIGEEIARTGTLSEEYVDQLLRQIKNGDL